jgi:hypothetical protein
MRNHILLAETLDEFVHIADILDSSVRQTCCLAFNELADLQRGHPERMGGACFDNPNLHPNGTGIYTHTTEHIGDLTHRMSQRWATGEEGEGSFGFEYVQEKVARALGYMRNQYGFERDIREQVARNLAYYQREKGTTTTEKEWWIDLEEAGIRYANAHRSLPVYNEAQWVARQAAIDIGNMDFDTAKLRLERLDAHLSSADHWASYAGLVAVANAKPKPFGG